MTNTTTSKRSRRMAREPKAEAASTPSSAAAGSTPDEAPTRTKAPNKTDTVISLLRRAEGATLDELVAVTGWLPHTARAAMTGLKKKGHLIERSKNDGVSRYNIVETAAQ